MRYIGCGLTSERLVEQVKRVFRKDFDLIVIQRDKSDKPSNPVYHVYATKGRLATRVVILEDTEQITLKEDYGTENT